jgi:hypothetical protein
MQNLPNKKWKAIFEGFIKNYFYLYLLDFGTCVAFTRNRMHSPKVKILLFRLRINVGQFWVVLYTAIIQKTRPLPVTLFYRERAVNDISYSKCTQ